ncbi:MAG: VOC family protein [Actinomycetes bacterium]
MRVRVAHVVLDCTDLARVSAFWSNLLALEVAEQDEEWLDLEPVSPGGAVLSFQRVPEPKVGKNRVHLDLDVPDALVAGERARELGASPASDVNPGARGPWRVWRDPEGNEFCLISDGSAA